MSLDVSIYSIYHVEELCHGCGETHDCIRVIRQWHRNITNNLNTMASSIGIYKPIWYPEELGISHTRELVPVLRMGLHTLLTDPERCRAFSPSSGWGSYETLLEFVRQYLEACEAYPDSEIGVSR